MEHRVISQDNSDRSPNSFYWLSMIIVLWFGQKNLNGLLQYENSSRQECIPVDPYCPQFSMGGPCPGVSVLGRGLCQRQNVNRMTDMCKNITLLQTLFAGDNNYYKTMYGPVRILELPAGCEGSDTIWCTSLKCFMINRPTTGSSHWMSQVVAQSEWIVREVSKSEIMGNNFTMVIGHLWSIMQMILSCDYWAN